MKKKFLVPVALALTSIIATSTSASAGKLHITKPNPNLQPAQWDNHSSHYSHSSHSSHSSHLYVVR